MSSQTWPKKKIGELFDIGAGKSVTPAARLGTRRFPFLRTSNVFWGRIDLTELDAMNFSDEEIEVKSLRKGDLLVCEGGDIGRAAIWNGEVEKCGFQNHLHRLRPKTEDMLARFCMYYLQAGFTQLGIYEGAGNKTTIPNLSRSRLANLDVPQPPRPEQEKIAAMLWKIQRAIAVEEKLVGTARELKQSTMRQLFAHGLRDKPQKETPYGAVPNTWQIKALSEWAYVQGGATKGRVIRREDAIDVPYLRVANVQDGHLDLSEMKTIRIRRDELDGYSLQKDDVVLTEGGDFDKLGRGFIWEGQIEPCVHQNHVFAVRVNRDRLWPRYFAYLAQSPYGKAYFLTVAHKTTNLACINTTKLRAFPVLRPELDEQKEIAAILQTIDSKISVHERKRAMMQELFKTMLHQLMTGQIPVHHLDIDTSEIVDAGAAKGSPILQPA
jgi:type I restriction enzyme, S subunit